MRFWPREKSNAAIASRTAQLTADTCDRSGTALRQRVSKENTPLFYYILKEAELRAGGLSLGPVGSHIVSEVIQGALRRILTVTCR